MANCRKCGAPIFFLTERPEWIAVGSFKEQRPVLTEVKARPIDVNPHPDGGIILYEYPPRNCVYFGRDYPRQRFFRRLIGAALAEHIREGKATFKSHFDTCRGPRA